MQTIHQQDIPSLQIVIILTQFPKNIHGSQMVADITYRRIPSITIKIFKSTELLMQILP